MHDYARKSERARKREQERERQREGARETKNERVYLLRTSSGRERARVKE